jgi:hypothetical protein
VAARQLVDHLVEVVGDQVLDDGQLLAVVDLVGVAENLQPRRVPAERQPLARPWRFGGLEALCDLSL